MSRNQKNNYKILELEGNDGPPSKYSQKASPGYYSGC